jgi:hypothetical protein
MWGIEASRGYHDLGTIILWYRLILRCRCYITIYYHPHPQHPLYCMYVVGATVTLDIKVHGQINFLRFVFCFVVRIRWYRQCIEKWREGINATCKYSRVTADGYLDTRLSVTPPQFCATCKSVLSCNTRPASGHQLVLKWREEIMSGRHASFAPEPRTSLTLARN